MQADLNPFPRKKVTDQHRLWAGIVKGPTCWEWSRYRNRQGYGNLIVGSRLNGTRRTVLAHRFVYELIYGPIPNRLLVCHRCDNPSCCNPSHLFLGTNADNARDCMDKGRYAHIVGEDRPGAKLTGYDVLAIRALHATGAMSYVAIAKRFGITPETISNAVRRRTWKHIA